MRGPRLHALLLTALLAFGGCQGTGASHRVARAEPPLVDESGSTPSIVETAPPRTVTFADRHPLFSKPRYYYDSTGKNKVAKVAAATVIGVPAGLVGEFRQIFRGQPQSQGSY